jgi:hypothetical protein
MPLKTIIKYWACWRNRNKRVEQKRGAQVAICGPHFAPGDEDQVEATSEE